MNFFLLQVDRMLSVVTIPCNEFDLVAAGCLLIARSARYANACAMPHLMLMITSACSKMEEMKSGNTEDFWNRVRVKGYERHHILQMELVILNKLKYAVNPPTSLWFAHGLLQHVAAKPPMVSFCHVRAMSGGGDRSIVLL